MEVAGWHIAAREGESRGILGDQIVRKLGEREAEDREDVIARCQTRRRQQQGRAKLILRIMAERKKIPVSGGEGFSNRLSSDASTPEKGRVREKKGVEKRK